ncbi:MAG: glycosyltransferase [Fimbriiglobus sp.]
MTISVCLVTRNHAAALERAVRSVAGVASEIVVCDTGSTDDTVPLAGRLGARVVDHAWADDFSAACNAALAAATGDWVLWINPDEVLGPAGPALRGSVNHPGAFAYRLRVCQQLNPGEPAAGTEDWQLRLFRRDPGIRHRGRLYPAFDPPVEAVAAARGGRVGFADVTILRHADPAVPTPDKLRWAVRLLEAELRDRPGQLPYLIEYGRHLLWLTDPKGHDVLGEAATAVQAAAGSPVAPDREVGRLLEYLLQVSPYLSKSPIGRDEARALAEKWFPTTPPVVWAVAAERSAAGDHAGAADRLARLLQMGVTGTFDSAGGFDPSIVGPAARLNLASSLAKLGRWAEVRQHAGMLLAVPEHRDAAMQLYGLAEQSLRVT